MEKQKRWQFFLILAVLLLTIYNILPTVFYYANPLKKPVGEKESQKIAQEIVQRVNSLESFTLSWLKAESKNLGLRPLAIELDSKDPKIAKVTFKKPSEAAFFAKTLQRAGALIPFVPAGLSPDPRSFDRDATTVIVQRRIGIHLDPKETNSYFRFVSKWGPKGEISPFYKELIADRVVQLATGFGGESESAKILQDVARNESDETLSGNVLRLARHIVEFENSFGDTSPITKRYFASFSQTNASIDKSTLLSQFTARLEKISSLLGSKIGKLKERQQSGREKGEFLSSLEQQQLEILESQKNTIDAASLIVRRNLALFEQGSTPLTAQAILSSLNKNHQGIQIVDIGEHNAFISKLEVNWAKDEVSLVLHPDVTSIRDQAISSESIAMQQEKLSQLLFQTIAHVARTSDESITPSVSGFTVKLGSLMNSSSLLALDIGAIASEQVKTISQLLTSSWSHSSPEFNAFPIETRSSLTKNLPKLGVVIYAPATDKSPAEGFHHGSLYVIARGSSLMQQKYRDLPDSPEKSSFETDFRAFQGLMRQNGFIGYQGAESDLPQEFKNDYIFELDDYYSYLLAATRENFVVKGTKHYATLEFTDVEQRLLTLNKIETSIHEDLLRWKDEYQASRISLIPNAKYDVPPPTQSAFWSNLALSTKKYFRGDERKILKWGLDLSGGKTVRVGLKDQNNQSITDEQDLRQAVNELYQRVNKLGVSEVGIRTEGSTIVLDFPGAQGLTATDLIQASAMYFHIVNEKFTVNNPTLAEPVNTFLEEVWNEAVITRRTDMDSLNEIAWQHLGGSVENPDEFRPLTSHARILYENGLRFKNPKSAAKSSAFNDTVSMVSTFRGSSFSDWQGQTYPLLIVFHNYALEGSNLTNVQTGYDPSEGNLLSFAVKGSYVGREGQKINPQEDFYTWTSQFSEEKVAGTPREAYSQGRGWRMAVILNGSIINAPTLNATLKDSGRISGHFSQREVNQLAADLKAGSLSFTPHILSEENISPDLGKEQRFQGIFAALLGLVLVIGVMCAYYRFGGVVASVAVLVNLLILWGVLQNLGAALTLPSIAGIILAIGMSVDANVLVFERIREEFAISKRLPSAIQAGYQKAFSAIVDSNLTTIIAAVILLNFDSGPIKGFALTLIIGILSSMFTALFMTRYFFAGWVQNPHHKTLHMSRFFGSTSFDFLSKAKTAFMATAIFLVVGLSVLVMERHTIFGMDFTGGYAITLEVQERPNTDYRLVAINALKKAGASENDFMVRELTKPNQLRLQLGMSMEQPHKPFYEIEKRIPIPEKSLFTYQSYPRIVWIVNALAAENLVIQPATLPDLNLHWSEMSGQLSDSMRNNALIGLGLALLCILIYITFRFEFKYAISATIGLAHDILVTLAILAIIHLFYEGLQIDLQVIAALMTIVGYSLNDTIIIFDRIREDMRLMRKMRFSEIINHALNATLSRTVMTSGTTLVVLLALVIFGGKSIFNFSLIMTIGIGVGTLSSLFIAAPLLLYFHNREVARHEERALQA